MSMLYSFTVPGNPKGQARPRFVRMQKFVRAYDPKDAVDYKARIATFALQAGVKTIMCPAFLAITAYVKRPKRLDRARDPQGAFAAPCKPDVDNIAKAVMDALNGISWPDDVSVTALYVTKRYVARGEMPRLVVEISEDARQ